MVIYKIIYSHYHSYIFSKIQTLTNINIYICRMIKKSPAYKKKKNQILKYYALNLVEIIRIIQD